MTSLFRSEIPSAHECFAQSLALSSPQANAVFAPLRFLIFYAVSLGEKEFCEACLQSFLPREAALVHRTSFGPLQDQLTQPRPGMDNQWPTSEIGDL